MTSFAATRNTCFAIISSIEEDFRTLILGLADTNGRTEELLPTDVKDAALKRRTADQRMDSITSVVPSAELIQYIDFGDIAKILESRVSKYNDSHKIWFTEVSRHLLSLTSARNRVCHSRPLETQDLPNLFDFSKILVDRKTPFKFPKVALVLSRLKEEPGFVLTLQIPTYWRDKPRIHHNLPIPEFDDTGFLGRKGDRLKLLTLLGSHYPVVTVVGEGGIGKTALALRCLYDLLDDPSAPYDAIVWVSLKTSMLTHSGVRELSGAITSTLGLLSEVARKLGMPVDHVQRPESDYIDEIVEHLELFRTIVAIDNLETISAGPLRDLLIKVPPHSKLLLTSRVGVGEFEVRYPLQGLDEMAAVGLMRANAKILGVSELQKMDDGNLKGFARKLFFNPLLVKWFVASVGRGANLTSIVNKQSESFSDALSFCFENLFDRLGAPEREIVNCLASARKALTLSEVHYLLPSLSTQDAETALATLHNSSVVFRSLDGGESFEYSLTESAATFISSLEPPTAEFFKKIQVGLRALRNILTDEAKRESRHDYDPNFFRAGASRDERICATYLRRALDYSRNSNYISARSELSEAKRLAPQSSEVWRISALIEQYSGELYKANEYFEQSISLNPNSTIARYCYSSFLITHMESYQEALDHLVVAEAIDPSAAPILTNKALALLRLGTFGEAAAIHDQLLSIVTQRPRRWRLTSADQAAECYRRWAFRDWELKEYQLAKQRFNKALAILIDSAERGDHDEKILQRSAKVLNECLSKRELASDVIFTESIITGMEKLAKTASGASIPILTEATFALRSPDISENQRNRLVSLDRSASRG